MSDYVEFTEQNLRDHARTIAASLRRLAESVEREADSKHAAYIANNVQHEVIWGVANLSLDRLTTRQAEWARARADEAKGGAS